ncbi:MAG: DUF1501 domain-containing protein [Gammaproteobacteria bacterium]|nr:DUF1501 domain-containing protein [Gammaproteobacteria bacterium]
MLTRRQLVKALGLTAVAGSLPAAAFAKTDGDARFVLVILRGAVDGLALAAPYGDGNYAAMRGALALPAPGSPDGIFKLDGLFGLHPALPGLFDLYERREALLVHAVASPYRQRSHFDGQDVLELGANRIGTLRDGWLNRALAPLSKAAAPAIALAANTPLVLRGDNAATSWAPSRLPEADDSTLRRLQRLYARDEFFATRLEQALKSRDIASAAEGMRGRASRGNEARQFTELMTAAARFLNSDDGPTIAVLEFGGWDTHANQGTTSGVLANRFAALDTGIANLRTGLGDSWRNTVVTVVTEFGRTVRVNGTRGTDHGTASAAIVAGGAVDGRRVIADWPGLGEADLYQGRDLRPTIDIRSVFKSVLVQHLELPAAFVERTVFPDSNEAAAIGRLIGI